jgi:hypothetical protein
VANIDFKSTDSSGNLKDPTANLISRVSKKEDLDKILKNWDHPKMAPVDKKAVLEYFGMRGEIPKTITTTSEAIKYAQDTYGLSKEAAINWVRHSQ